LDQNIDNDTLDTIMETRYKMLDVLGVNQHHDAVSGTEKQAVADDYAKMLWTGMDMNSKPYSQMIGE
jgi:hypothetical protein